MERQALACRVTVGGQGAMTLVAGGRSDLLRAAAWALQTGDPGTGGRPGDPRRLSCKQTACM